MAERVYAVYHKHYDKHEIAHRHNFVLSCGDVGDTIDFDLRVG